ncbi:Pirin-like protein YhaK [Sodalis glossinidius str. 'morsitans']|nr:Pirin-like protein YhaK [Sodalis glossinidius str. 'morsitans']
MHYASLRALNQEVLAVGAAFQPRTYPPVDVLNIILRGEAEYRDSNGHAVRVAAGVGTPGDAGGWRKPDCRSTAGVLICNRSTVRGRLAGHRVHADGLPAATAPLSMTSNRLRCVPPHRCRRY